MCIWLCVFTSGHVTKMVVTPLDPPYPKTPCCMHTSRLYVWENLSYCRSKFYISGIGIFYVSSSCDLDLDLMTSIELHPKTAEIHCMCNYELPTSRLSKVIIWQTYTTKSITQYTRCFVDGKNQSVSHWSKKLFTSRTTLHSKANKTCWKVKINTELNTRKNCNDRHDIWQTCSSTVEFSFKHLTTASTVDVSLSHELLYTFVNWPCLPAHTHRAIAIIIIIIIT